MEAVGAFAGGVAHDVRHGVLQEGTHFLHKPFTPTVQARKVREILDARDSLRVLNATSMR